MLILSLALIVMIAFSVLAVQLILWQSADISVSIVSENDNGKNEVTISVLNTAGSTLLFYENTEVAGKIEYLSDSGWVEYCDVSYTAYNTGAFSSQYGGTFAELQPGENWKVSVPEDKIAGMTNGTYRIKMTYITEKNYNAYLNDAFNKNNAESSKKPNVKPETTPNPNVNGLKPVVNSEISESEDISKEERFLAEGLSEIYVETFEYFAPEDFVGEFSIDDSDIENSDYSTTKARIIIN